MYMRKALRNYIHKHVKAGAAPDLGPIEFRSTWERNVARVLNYLGIRWTYEPRRFYLIKGLTYLPDFRLESPNPWECKWIEVKGLWNKDDKKKLKYFYTLYPDETLKVISGKQYRKLCKEYKNLIPTWEGPKAPAKKRKPKNEKPA